MKHTVLLLALLGCSASSSARTTPPRPDDDLAMPAPTWLVPLGWRAETIAFPLQFAPSLAHQGVEEIRFAPGFFEPDQPGYWSYVFVWRTDDAAHLDAAALGSELTAYYAGLIAAVDDKGRITTRDQIVVRAEPEGDRFELTAHVFDAFTTAAPLDLVGWAKRTACGPGALWVFVLSPEQSTMRDDLDGVAATAECGQVPR